MRAGDLAGGMLRLEPVAVAKPCLEFMAVGAAQRKQDHRDDLLHRFYTGIRSRSNSRTVC